MLEYELAQNLQEENMNSLMRGEAQYCEGTREKDLALRSFLAKCALPESIDARTWLAYLVGIKSVLGNISNNLGFVATFLVKEYLATRFGIIDFDVAGKAQGASGEDIVAVAADGRKIIGELKTIKPYQPGFGAAQRTSMLKDLGRLAASSADHRFMFVTDADAFSTLCKPVFARRASGVEIVDLVTGRAHLCSANGSFGWNLPHHIGVLTPELVCFHEAGHVVTAAMIGATVTRVALVDGPPPQGVSTIERTAPQTPFIACGGFAAEYFLSQTKRLVNASGQPVDAGEFLSEAAQNAQRDVDNYVNGLAAMNVRVDDAWGEFIGTALTKVSPQLDFKLVERVAASLLRLKVLDEAHVRTIIGSRGFRIVGRYQLQRMNGLGRINSVARALRGFDQ